MNKTEEIFNWRRLAQTQVDKKDGHYAVSIFLYKFDRMNEAKLIKDIAQAISHEYLHVAMLEASDFQTSKQADNGLMKKLEQEGYL